MISFETILGTNVIPRLSGQLPILTNLENTAYTTITSIITCNAKTCLSIQI